MPLGRQLWFNPQQARTPPDATFPGGRASQRRSVYFRPSHGPVPMSQPTLDPFASLQGALEPQYRLERELGRGGMGVVFLATDTTLDRRVAIKVVHPELAAHQSIVRRFLAEARTIARLRHPNIVAVHTAGTADGLLYYVMNEVKGEPPRQRPPQEGRLDPAEAGRILADVAAALDAAGRARGVHPGLDAGKGGGDPHTGRASL